VASRLVFERRYNRRRERRWSLIVPSDRVT